MKVAVGLRRVAAGKRTSGRRAAQIAVHSLQGTKIFAKHDIDTKLPCNFKRVSGTAAFYQFLTDP